MVGTYATMVGTGLLNPKSSFFFLFFHVRTFILPDSRCLPYLGHGIFRSEAGFCFAPTNQFFGEILSSEIQEPQETKQQWFGAPVL